MNEKIQYSIIVVCLNAGERLYDTIQSIRNQKYPFFEIVIKDGGSTDGSVQKIEKDISDERICIYTKKDTGIYDAMNQAVKLAKEDYYLFLNAGDTFYDNQVLNKITDEIKRQNTKKEHVDILYGNMHHKTLNTVIYASPEINDFTCYRNIPCHQTCFYHKKLFEERGYYPKYNVRADYEHFLWCYYEMNANIQYVPVIIASYEGGGYSETKENKKRSACQHREIVVHYMGKKRANYYRFLMLLTMAPLRSAIAQNKQLSGIYNWLKRGIYRRNVQE